MLYFQNKIVCISLGFSSSQSTHLGVASSRNLGPNITYNIGSEITRTSDSLMLYWVGPSRNTVFRRKCLGAWIDKNAETDICTHTFRINTSLNLVYGNTLLLLFNDFFSLNYFWEKVHFLKTT